MADIKFTPQQQKAIDITKQSLVVSAAAGSGKTAVLVERICDILCDSTINVSPSQFLIVTFTRATAKEMSDRIERRMREKVSQYPYSKWLKNQLMTLPLATVCTIDAFCQQLVKEYFFYCDMSSDFEIADNSQLAQMSEQALGEAIEFMYKNYGEDFEDLNRALFAEYDDKGLRDTVTNLYKYIYSLPSPEKYLDLIVERYEVVDGENYYLTKNFEFLLQELDLLLFKIDAFKKDYVYTENLINSAEHISSLIDCCKAGNISECSQLLNSLPKPQKSDLSENFSEDECKKILEFEKSIADKLEKLGKEYSTNALLLNASMGKLHAQAELLVTLERKYIETLSRIKKEKNLYGFNDIEHKALSLIYDFDADCPTEFGNQLSKRFAYVMADEYQDTNDLQDKIFNILSDGGKKLFAVGDAKQSIYRFRQANPEVFIALQKQNNLPQRSVVSLSANFRSRPDICDAINAIFGGVMSREMGDVEYDDNESLVAKAEYPDDDEKGAEYWLIDSKESIFSQNQTEAHYIAKWIREKLDEGYEIYDVKQKQYRKMEQGDIAILLRNANSWGADYKKVLTQYGLSVFFRADANPYKSLEVQMVLDLLKTVNNPRYDLSLLSVLLSPFCRLTADDLAQIRNYGSEDLYSSLILASDDGMDKAKKSLDFINRMRANMLTMPLVLFLEDIYASSGFYACVGAMTDGDIRRANLRKLSQLAQNYSKKSSGSLIGFIKTVEHLAQDSADSSKAASDGNSVQITTIHNSKGLEYPVCFVAGLSHSINGNSSDNAIMHQNAGLGFCYYDRDLDMRFKNLPRTVIERENKRESLSEELRILYVALTRAKNKLILISAEKNLKKKLNDLYEATSGFRGHNIKKLSSAFVLSQKTYGDILLSACMISKIGGQLRGLAVENPIVDDEVDSPIKFLIKDGLQVIDEAENPDISDGIADAETAGLLKERFAYQYPHQADTLLPSKITASQLNLMDHGDMYNFSRRPTVLQEDALSPTEKGTALHNFMQFCDFLRAAENPRDEGERLTELGFITERQLASLDFEKAERFFASELYGRIIKSSDVMREKQFTVVMPSGELKEFEASERNIVVQGVCDLAFLEDGTLTVIDYKTDKCQSAQELFARYKNQLELYATCLEKMTDYKVGKIGIYSFYTGEFCEEAFTNA